jgi:hypothetical protein
LVILLLLSRPIDLWTYLLKVCEVHAKVFHIKLNSSKNILFTYNDSHNVLFVLNNSVISWVEGALHLGHHININDNTNNIHQGNINLICHTNTMLSRFGFHSSEIKSSLFQRNCTNCPLWDLNSWYITNVYITGPNSIRCVWGLLFRTHNAFVSIIPDDVPITVPLLSRFSSFALMCNKTIIVLLPWTL